MPNHPETEHLVRRYVDAIASRVLEDVFAFYDDDIVYEDTAVRQIYRGIEATKEFYKKSMTALAVSWSVDTIVCHESGFGLAWVMTGRHEQDLPGMPARAGRSRCRAHPSRRSAEAESCTTGTSGTTSTC